MNKSLNFFLFSQHIMKKFTMVRSPIRLMTPPGSLHCNLLMLHTLLTIPEAGKLLGNLHTVLYTVMQLPRCTVEP